MQTGPGGTGRSGPTTPSHHPIDHASKGSGQAGRRRLAPGGKGVAPQTKVKIPHFGGPDQSNLVAPDATKSPILANPQPG